MSSLPVRLTSERLILRQWESRDIEPFARMNADPVVMRYFPAPMTDQQTEQMVQRIMENFSRLDFGLWAVELRASAEFMGFIGLNSPTFQASFTPCVEIGWRLAQKFWGCGYATEGALTAISDGFERLGLGEIVSFTTAANYPSINVMKRIGMIRDADSDFNHPALDVSHSLAPHVLYRLSAARWRSLQTSCVREEI